jgi:metallo-beta-lactamase family protein
MYQGRREESRNRNRYLPSPALDADAVVLTHAHIDHSGNLPSLVKHGFDGSIYATTATRDLCQAMLRDSAHIQEHDAEYLNRKFGDEPGWEEIQPIYTEKDAVETMYKFVTYSYWRSFEPVPGVRATFYDAGHVLGSAGVLVEAEGKRILFSGDIGRRDMPILRDPEIPANADYVVMESTYGDREHGPIEETRDELARVINETVRRKGKIIIPSFALERTQEIVYGLNELIRQKKIEPLPVYVDSPLAVNLTQVFKSHPECYDFETLQFLETHGDPFGFDMLRYTQSVDESIALNDEPGPMIIISASGMCEAGRILHHLRNNIESPRNTIVIVGFMAQHTLGRRLAERRDQVRIFGVMRDRGARVEVLDGFSAHAGQSELISYAKMAGPETKRVFLVHGEPRPQDALEKELEKRSIDVTVPAMGDIETL